MNATLLRTRRLALGFTQARLADKAGVDVRTIGRAEAGQAIAPETLLAVCAVLNLGTEEVMGPPVEAGGCAGLTIIRSGKPEDQVHLLPEVESVLAEVRGVDTVVLPDVSMSDAERRSLRPSEILKPHSLGHTAFVAALLVPGGGSVAVLLARLGLIEHVHTCAGFIVSVGGAILMAALMMAMVYRLELPFRAESVRMRRGLALDRVYAFGSGKVHVLHVTPDQILRREAVIDPRRPVRRWVSHGTVNYSVPAQGERIELYGMPEDPRIDAMLMRDAKAWGYHARPRATDSGTGGAVTGGQASYA